MGYVRYLRYFTLYPYGAPYGGITLFTHAFIVHPNGSEMRKRNLKLAYLGYKLICSIILN